VLGPNGAGKSTLLRCLAGLAPPQSGSLASEGDDLATLDDRERARRIGILLQEDETVFPASVLDTVMIGRHPHLGRWEWESAHDRAIALRALHDVELEDLCARDVTTLSGGERRRVAIAAVLSQQPRLGLWDEPLNHLDPRHQRRILGRLTARVDQPAHAGVFVLHDVNLAVRHCSHALLLYGDGRTASGRIETLLDAERLGELYDAPIRALGDGIRIWYVFD
jgi:iron complex transport system ATP-binding protein